MMTEWINVKDRLPTNNQYVLAYYEYDPSDGSWDHRKGYKLISFQYGGRVHEYPKDKPGYTLSHWDSTMPNWGLDDCYKITHWAELPKEPKS